MRKGIRSHYCLANTTSFCGSEWIMLFFLCLCLLCLLCILCLFCLLWFCRREIVRVRNRSIDCLIRGWILWNFSLLLGLGRLCFALFTGLLLSWLSARLTRLFFSCCSFCLCLKLVRVHGLLILSSWNELNFCHPSLLSCLICISFAFLSLSDLLLLLWTLLFRILSLLLLYLILRLLGFLFRFLFLSRLLSSLFRFLSRLLLWLLFNLSFR